MKIGLLALQGCVEPHCVILRQLGCTVHKVRLPEDLDGIDGLILPGGESTTMLSLIEKYGLFEPLVNFVRSRPTWGICAGAILLAQEVVNPCQKSLAALPIRAHRNYYGSQRESFSSTIECSLFSPPLQVDFIRAPRLEALSDEVEVLGKYSRTFITSYGSPQGSDMKDQHCTEAVLIRSNHVLACSFHTELSPDLRLHKYFIDMR